MAARSSESRKMLAKERDGRTSFTFGTVSKQQLPVAVPCLLVKQEDFSANSFFQAAIFPQIEAPFASLQWTLVSVCHCRAQGKCEAVKNKLCSEAKVNI